MKRGNGVSLYTTRLRMETIEERMRATTLPTLDRMFNSVPADTDLLKLMVENMTFSDYPGAKLGNASSLAGFLMNSNNIADFRASGCLGAIVEILRRTNIEDNPESEDVVNLVTSLHIICDGDLSVQRRLMNHPTGLATIIRLCKRVTGKLQVMAFDILEWLGKLETDSQQKLLDKNIIKVLLKPAFMYRPSTLLATRYRAAQMVRSLIHAAPDRMRVYDFADICVDEHGRRRISGDMEQWLLHATAAHLQWRVRANAGHLPKVFTLMGHLISEVLTESFDNIEHMQLIMRCCTLLSSDPKHIRYMLDNSLGPALQYLVRTDFKLFRSKSKKTVDSGSTEREKLRKISKQVHTKRLSIQDSGERPASTLMFLALIRPVQKATARGGDHDVNFSITKIVCSLFERIIDYDSVIIADLVGSGLVPALLFRVGKGQDRDLRFNKIVVHLHCHLLCTVTMAQPHRGYHMSQFKLDVSYNAEAKKDFFWPRGMAPPPPELSAPHLFAAPAVEVDQRQHDIAAPIALPDDGSVATEADDNSSLASAHARKVKQQSTDLLVVSNTLCAHGLADVLFATLRSSQVPHPIYTRLCGACLYSSLIPVCRSILSNLPLFIPSFHVRIFCTLLSHRHRRLVAGLQLEEPAVVREVIMILAMMKYAVYHETAVLPENVDALFLIYRARTDCFYQFLLVLCEMVQYVDTSLEVLEDLVSKHKCMRVLVRALQMSGWAFHEKDMVYRCFGPLTKLSHFVQSLREVEGISIVCRDVNMRKRGMRQQRKQGQGEGDGTEQLLSALREDLAVIRIQALARRRQGFRRVCVLQGKSDPGAKNRKLVGKSKSTKPKKRA